MAMKSKLINYKQAQTELITILDWVRFSASVMSEAQVFLGHGNDNYWDEAVLLVLGVLHLPAADTLKFEDAKLITDERLKLANALHDRIENRMPTAYITHEAFCLGLPFYVDERVLIPRSPFAEWIEKRFEPWVDANSVHAILEIGVGSGVLAAVSALTFPEATIDAVDIDDSALNVAAINVERYALQEQVNLIKSNCYSSLNAKRYDVIFSNPPYVSQQEYDGLPPEYLHEPRSALIAEEDGLAIVLEIISKAKDHLTERGILLVEVGNTQETLTERMPYLPFIWLEQEYGGHGIFLLTKQQLDDAYQ